MKKQTKIILGIMVVVAIAIGVVLFNQSEQPSDGDTVRLGVILNLTGPSARVDGPKRQAMELALEYLKTHHKFESVQLLFEDGKSTGRDSIAAFRALENRGVSLFLAGSSLSAMPVAPLAKNSHVLLFGVSGHPDFTEQAGYGIRVYPEVSESSRILGTAISKTKPSRVMILHMEEPWTESYARALQDRLPSETSVTVEKYPVGHQDFRAIASKARSFRPDAVVILDFGISMQSIMSAFMELQVDAKYFGSETTHSANLPSLPGFKELDFVFLATGATYLASKEEDPFSTFFTQSTGQGPPPYYAVMCADALSLLHAVVQSHDTSGFDGTKWHNAITELTDIQSFSGPISVLETGDVQYNLRLFRYDGTQLVPDNQ